MLWKTDYSVKATTDRPWALGAAILDRDIFCLQDIRTEQKPANRDSVLQGTVLSVNGLASGKALRKSAQLG